MDFDTTRCDPDLGQAINTRAAVHFLSFLPAATTSALGNDTPHKHIIQTLPQQPHLWDTNDNVVCLHNMLLLIQGLNQKKNEGGHVQRMLRLLWVVVTKRGF